MCDNIILVQILHIIKIVLTVICYVIPPIIIIVSMIDISKVVISGKTEDLKEKATNSIKRVIAGLIVFFLPTFINLIFNSFDAAKDVEFLACYNEASQEKINELKNAAEKKAAAEKEEQSKKQEELNKEAVESYEESEKRKQEQQVTVNTNGLSASEFNQKLSSMNTPTISQLEQAASSNGIDSYYLKVIIGTTQNEGYYNDAYLGYGWASAMINNQVSIAQMQGWDPSRSGEANFYSETNIMRGYNSASTNTLKAVYLALTERNTKIIECNGMYTTTPSSYNKIYTSPSYSNISIYEVK